MKKIAILSTIVFSLLMSGCTFMGLDIQEDYQYKAHTLDPHINMTVWDFMNSNLDHQLDSLISAINYTGLQDEFKKPGRTFFLLHNLAIYGVDTKGVILPNCYFAKFKVNGKNGTKWRDYPVQQVRDFLLYHIVENQYSFDNLTPDNVSVTTLLDNMPKGTMLLRIVNDRDSKVTINEFFGSQKVTRATTSNILATDGTIHVLRDYAEYLP